MSKGRLGKKKSITAATKQCFHTYSSSALLRGHQLTFSHFPLCNKKIYQGITHSLHIQHKVPQMILWICQCFHQKHCFSDLNFPSSRTHFQNQFTAQLHKALQQNCKGRKVRGEMMGPWQSMSATGQYHIWLCLINPWLWLVIEMPEFGWWNLSSPTTLWLEVEHDSNQRANKSCCIKKLLLSHCSRPVPFHSKTHPETPSDPQKMIHFQQYLPE